MTALQDLNTRRRLPVVVASPTLAQGIDLACSVLIFRSLQRFDPATERQVSISAAEFANVVGRAGRAYVDLDGIAVLPTFEAHSRESRHQTFRSLIRRSHQQRLVSGLALLVNELGQQLAARLQVSPTELLEYVLNQRDLWGDERVKEEGQRIMRKRPCVSSSENFLFRAQSGCGTRRPPCSGGPAFSLVSVVVRVCSFGIG
jgi:hypothetical protein